MNLNSSVRSVQNWKASTLPTERPQRVASLRPTRRPCPSRCETGVEVLNRLKRDLVPTLLSGVMYWPMCDFITFRFIPVHLQTLVSNGFSYLWTIYLTYMASLEKASAVAAD